MEESISLSELASIISEGLKKSLEPKYWVFGEISEIQANRNGHCYLELIEKPEDEENPTAKMRATIWANVYRMLAPYFESETGSQLSVGMKIMVQVSVNFHALYGFSLQITDINPSYTVGEDELRRQKIIHQLEEDGVFELNKEIELPSVIQRVAVISSNTAAGYQDFINQLENNPYGFDIRTTLFNAAMQGVEVENSVIKCLDEIANHEDEFDVVVIIRGGGARTDLRWFDNYKIASNVAQFPLPVLTGIGHNKDLSITDMVAHTSLKTPTAVADFIIDINEEFVSQLNDFQEQLSDLFHERMDDETDRLRDFLSAIKQSHKITLLKAESSIEQTIQGILHATAIKKTKALAEIEKLQQRIFEGMRTKINLHANRLQLAEAKIDAKNPETILKSGYSLTTNRQGKIIRSHKQVKSKEIITTHFADGEITSTVN